VSELLDGLDSPEQKQVLLQGPDETFGAAVALRGANEGWRAFGAYEAELVPEIIGDIVDTVIVGQG